MKYPIMRDGWPETYLAEIVDDSRAMLQLIEPPGVP